ncbi:MAG: isochorismate synthase [Synechococcus sp.]|nr:isochorismate synthase [Synechococcus sp.]
MLEAPCFTELLSRAAARAQALDEGGVLSLALPLEPLDPLQALPQLPGGHRFRALWDGQPGLSFAATGVAQQLELSGPRRFELAQRFCQLSLSRLQDGAPEAPALARPRVLLAFSFFDAPLQEAAEPLPGVRAVLPRWQLSRQGRQCWLRLQRNLGGEVTPRLVAEELWEQARALQRISPPSPAAAVPQLLSRSPWHGAYRSAMEQALELVGQNRLRKLVLAVRQQLQLSAPLDPQLLLQGLRQRQAGSCRFLWGLADGGDLVGASPERLLAVRQGQLRCDALAGTASQQEPPETLLRSAKDRHEHELVVEAITQVLQQQGLRPRQPRHPRLASHGPLRHLHTPITAALQGQHPLALAEALHPTPAVAGLPRREAMDWLRLLEPFERGAYAAPIGWVDSAGDAELRVAIRSGVLRGSSLELTAGAGLVQGSEPERELQEVALKLEVLQQQLSLSAAAGAAG